MTDGSEEQNPPRHDGAATSEEYVEAVTIGGSQVHGGPIELVEYDASWPNRFDLETRRISAALGERALRVEHAGSTSVPGLAAKPIIDIVLVVADSSDEDAYVGPLEAAGYDLRIREPDWYEHRMFKASDRAVNLHVFSEGCPEVMRMLAFRDRLRRDPDDRSLYERTKRRLAARQWKYVQDYADAKGAVVEEMLARVSDARIEAAAGRDLVHWAIAHCSVGDATKPAAPMTSWSTPSEGIF